MRFNLSLGGWRGALVMVAVGALWTMAAPTAWAAGSISLSPPNQTGTEFSVDIDINTGSDQVIEAQVVLDFNPAILEVTQATIADLFTAKVTPTIDNVAGKLTLLTYMIEESDSFVGNDTLATVQFRGKATGVSAVTVRCTPQATNDSNLRKSGSAADILDCQQVTNGSYTVSGGAEISPTPTPTVRLSPTVSITPTSTISGTLEIGSSGDSELTPTPPSELLTTASLTPTLTIAMIGAILLIGSLFLFIW